MKLYAFLALAVLLLAGAVLVPKDPGAHAQTPPKTSNAPPPPKQEQGIVRGTVTLVPGVGLQVSDDPSGVKGYIKP